MTINSFALLKVTDYFNKPVAPKVSQFVFLQKLCKNWSDTQKLCKFKVVSNWLKLFAKSHKHFQYSKINTTSKNSRQKFWYFTKVVAAENQGKHQHFDPSLLAYICLLIFMGMKEKKLKIAQLLTLVKKTDTFNSPNFHFLFF